VAKHAVDMARSMVDSTIIKRCKSPLGPNCTTHAEHKQSATIAHCPIVLDALVNDLGNPSSSNSIS
jgi:hypothetical protein